MRWTRVRLAASTASQYVDPTLHSRTYDAAEEWRQMARAVVNAAVDAADSGRPNRTLWGALDTAYPLPDTLTDAWNEYQSWERLTDARCAFDEYYDTPPHVRARQHALEHLLDTIMEPTFDGFTVRLEWLAWCNEHSVWRFQEESAVMLKRLRDDFAMLREITEDRMKAPSWPKRRRIEADQMDLFEKELEP
jgi:hypothetical protein